MQSCCAYSPTAMSIFAIGRICKVFTIPYHRYLAMEANVEGSFFETDTWTQIAKRIQ